MAPPELKGGTVKLRVLVEMASIPVKGESAWLKRDSVVEVTAEDFAAIEQMEYIGSVVEVVAEETKKGAKS